ncbi:tail fiber protein [Janthinobacterium sp. 64]|uniref:tail fiber protein n=1 Tax=Janthinobacterium sp. 64 TaxID=2035208 RepID=UPI001E2B6F6B|nr:tail fiber protein [Janthinobacterium sp. 64]
METSSSFETIVWRENLDLVRHFNEHRSYRCPSLLRLFTHALHQHMPLRAETKATNHIAKKRYFNVNQFQLIKVLTHVPFHNSYGQRNIMPEVYAGLITMVARGLAPGGFIACNGQLLPVQQIAALFSLLATQFGGNG